MARLIDADALETECYLGADVVHKEWLDNAPTVDAIPIEFIQKRIEELKRLNEYEFIANGGYTSPSDYKQWELERLIRDWKKQR